jgi:hypothetical protein
MSWETLLCIVVVILLLTLAIDTLNPWDSFTSITEGFLTGPGKNPFMFTYFPRRGDISFGIDEDTYVQENRHVMGYVDVQGLGVNHDFCRMIIPKGNDESDMFFACALAGTEHMSSTSFKTLTVKQGFRTSRDDYMRDADGDKKTDYCAVVKMPGGAFEAQCYRALNTTFDIRQFIDTDPPKDIVDILYFYEGIMFWFRFIDDMKDYAENLKTYTSGNMEIDEANVKLLPSQRMNDDPTTIDDRVQLTEGLQFNGINQFIRLGDSPDMSIGNKIILPTMKAMCFWVKFDEFTNNAHILDFGNGAGLDNVFIGIVGRGDPSIDNGNEIRKSLCETTVPDPPSGPQPVSDMSPQELMLSTANVDQYVYDKEIFPRNLPAMRPIGQGQTRETHANTATLIYEVWNGKLRMEHVNVLKAFKLKTWTHVCLTTITTDSVRPTLQIWIDGQKMAEKEGTHLPQVTITSNNYLGKNNWINSSSKFENKPELFKGNLFDVRGYNQPISQEKLKKTLKWGKLRLGLT